MGGGGGGASSSSGMSAAEFSQRMNERDAEWQTQVAQRDQQWEDRVNQEGTAAVSQYQTAQQQAAYQKKLNKPAGKIDSGGTGLPATVLTSAQGLGDDPAPDLSRTSLLGG